MHAPHALRLRLIDPGAPAGDPGAPAGDAEEAARVDARLTELGRAHGEYEFDLADQLRRAAALQVHRRHGYGSATDYVARRLGLSTREAREKLRVAHALAELPELSRALATGALSWSAARELTRVATADTDAEWVAFADGLTVRQLERAVARRGRGDGPRSPAGVGPEAPRRWVFELAAEDEAMVRAALDAVWATSGSATVAPTQGTLLRMMAEVVLGRRAVEAPAYQTALTVCAGCARAWSTAGGELREVPESIAGCARCDGEVVGLADVEGLDLAARGDDGAPGDAPPRGARGEGPAGGADATRAPGERATASHVGHEAEGRAATTHVGHEADGRAATTHVGRAPDTPHAPPALAVDAGPALAHLRRVAEHGGGRALLRLFTRALGVPLRSLTPQLRRRALARDGGRCVVPGCRSWRFIDVHHLQPRALGGSHALDNLACLCTSHHRAVHEGALALQGSAERGWVARYLGAEGRVEDARPR